MPVTAELHIPVDEVAEEALAGVVVSSSRGFDLAVAHGIQADYFYLPKCRRVFVAAGGFRYLSGADDESLAGRITGIAKAAELPVSEIQRLRGCRVTMFDQSGSLARRVLRAYQSRALMSLCDRIYTRLGEGERYDTVTAELAPDVQRLLGACA